MINPPVFGPWLKGQRKLRALSQKDLAGQVGCSVVLIEKIESGARRPSPQIAALLATCLAIPPHERRAFIEFARGATPPVVDRGAADADAAPWQLLPRKPHNLPAPPTGFIGREPVLTDLTATLREPGVRLLTLTGPPGIGKTRLSLELAARLLDEREHGAFFVALAAIRDPTLVLPAVAHALGVRETPGRLLAAALAAHLRDRHLLLVLDNLEQVLAAGPLVADLLRQAPRLQVVVTSRAVLHLYGEHEVPVPPLSLPDSAPDSTGVGLLQSEAIRLFAERARATDHTFALTAENGPAVAAICARLDGLPLAIELAAAQVRHLAPAEIVAQLPARLALLTGGPRDLPPRQQTLRGAIDWSYDLLSAPAQALFRGLAVFAGGCTPQAVQAVIGAGAGPAGPAPGPAASLAATRAQLRELADQSLLRAAPGGGGTTRFTMLETLREYAAERLLASGEHGLLQRRHAAYYLALAEEVHVQLKGAGQGAGLDRLEAEQANLRAALDWAAQQDDVVPGLRLGAALWKFWLLRGLLAEGRGRLAAALARPGPAPAGVRANALNGAGNLAMSAGDYPAARLLYEESLDLRRTLADPAGVAGSLNNLALTAHSQGDYAGARQLHAESLALKRTLGDQWGIASTLGNLGLIAQDQGDYAAARALFEESLAIRRALGDTHGIALSLYNLVSVALAQDDVDNARRMAEESLAIRRALGDRPGIAAALSNLGEVARQAGDVAAAGALYAESVALCRELGDRAELANALHNLGQARLVQGALAGAAGHFHESLALYAEAGDKRGIIRNLAALAALAVARGLPARAARLFAATETLLAATGTALLPIDRRLYDSGLRAVQAPGAATWAAAWAAGQALALDEVVAEALDGPPGD